MTSDPNLLSPKRKYPGAVSNALVALLIFAAGALVLPMVPASAAPAEQRTLCSADNQLARELRLPIFEWRDRARDPQAIIVGVHGLTFYAQAYDDIATHLARRGYAFYACDMRGFGNWSRDAARYGGDSGIHFTQTKDDVLRMIKRLKEIYPDKNLYCTGESVGANYAIWMASLEPTLVDGVFVSAPCYKTYWHPRPRWVLDFFRGLRHPKTEMALEPYIRPTLSHDQALTDGCLKDPMICRKMSPENLIKTAITNRMAIKGVKNIPSDLPILIIAGNLDQVYKTAALPALVNRIGSKQTTLMLLKDKGHLLFEHQEVNPTITGTIDAWLAKHCRETPRNATRFHVQM